jgi:septal ring factor EnvC (AmiA/AmiB activator)
VKNAFTTGVCRWLPWLLFVSLLGAPARASGLDDSRQKLAEIERRIRQASRSLEEKKAAEQSLAADLQTVESELSRLGDSIAGQRRRLSVLEADVATKTASAELARRSAAVLEGRVRQRLAALYKGGNTGPVRLLFSPTPPAVMAENYFYWGRIVRRDRQLLADYRRQHAVLQQALAELNALRQEHGRTLTALDQEQRVARQAQQLKQELLVQVRHDRKALASALSDLREKARALTDLVKRLESEKSAEYTEKTGFFASRKGRLPWPVNGPVRIGFGMGRHPDLGTLHESHGIEIAVSGEKPIRAVASGRVIFANWFKGYGNLLILDHGDSYYSLYAQASRLHVSVGQQVAEGAAVAESGLDGVDGVYFEIRQGSTPLDPTTWLAPH